MNRVLQEMSVPVREYEQSATRNVSPSQGVRTDSYKKCQSQSGSMNRVLQEMPIVNSNAHYIYLLFSILKLKRYGYQLGNV
jgi:hypothetical protein